MRNKITHRTLREDWNSLTRRLNLLKGFQLLKIKHENSLYFCILMSLKICKLVIIKPFSLAQLPRRPQSLKNQTVMPTLRERNALHLHYWWYVLEELPSENKKKEHFMMCFMFYVLYPLLSRPLWNSLRMQNITFETLFILGLHRLHKRYNLNNLSLPNLLWTQLCKCQHLASGGGWSPGEGWMTDMCVLTMEMLNS